MSGSATGGSGFSLDASGDARLALQEILRDYGLAGLDDEALIARHVPDLLPDAPREAGVLRAAAAARVGHLLTDRFAAQMPAEAAVRDVAAMLAERTALDANACRWIVLEYASALGHPVDLPPASAATSAQPNPVAPSSGQPMSGQPMSGQPMSGQAAAGQGLPGQVPPVGVPVTGQPPLGQAVSGQPVSGQPLSGQPVSGQPVSGQPVSGQPVSGQPTSGQPIQAAPGQPLAGRPLTGQSPAGQQQFGQPQFGQAQFGQPPAPGQPTPGQQTPGQPTSAQPASGQPGLAQPGLAQPGFGQPGLGQTAAYTTTSFQTGHASPVYRPPGADFSGQIPLPPQQQRSRTPLYIGIIVVVAVLVAAGIGIAIALPSSCTSASCTASGHHTTPPNSAPPSTPPPSTPPPSNPPNSDLPTLESVLPDDVNNGFDCDSDTNNSAIDGASDFYFCDEGSDFDLPSMQLWAYQFPNSTALAAGLKQLNSKLRFHVVGSGGCPPANTTDSASTSWHRGSDGATLGSLECFTGTKTSDSHKYVTYIWTDPDELTLMDAQAPDSFKDLNDWWDENNGNSPDG